MMSKVNRSKQINTGRRSSGFSLMELMVVLAIVAILGTVVIPSYSSYVRRGYITDALTTLSNLSLQMEEKYQENRTYRDPAAAGAKCAIADFTSNYFSFTCTTGARNTYVWSASSLNGGLGSAGAYKYSINQNSAKKTTAYDGGAINYNGWME